MHLANQSSGKPDKLSQGSSKLDKLSQSSMGDTLDIREATDLQGNRAINESMSPVNPEKQNRGEC